MKLYPNEKTSLILDGANTFAACKALGMHLDYKKIHTLYSEQTRLVEARYYTALDETRESNPMVPLVDYLELNGWAVITKPFRISSSYDSSGMQKRDGSMAVDVAVAICQAARWADNIIVWSGDGDLVPAVLAAQEQGCRVQGISTTTNRVASDDLRRALTSFTDLVTLANDIQRDRPAEAQAAPNGAMASLARHPLAAAR